MRVNRVVEKMKRGELAYGINMSFPSTTLVELAGRAGFEFVMFDGEHGPFTPQDIDDLCRVADMAGLTPMARVPNIDDSTILRFLDRGIMGILGPHITTADRPGSSPTPAATCLVASAPSGRGGVHTSATSTQARNTWSTPTTMSS